MYASIYGTVQEINANLIYLEHNNYGYEINLVTNKLFEFKKTMQIKLYTFLVVKDYFQWFGFLDLATKKIFCDLLTIPTIGVKTAVKLLQQISVEDLLTLVQQNNLHQIEQLRGLKVHSGRILFNALQKIYFTKKYNNLQNKVINCLKTLGYSLTTIYQTINAIKQPSKQLDQYLKIVLTAISKNAVT